MGMSYLARCKKCDCKFRLRSGGGRFKFDAPARCPRCKSDDIEAVGQVIMYD